jgi:hypothetical protein
MWIAPSLVGLARSGVVHRLITRTCSWKSILPPQISEIFVFLTYIPAH